MTTQQRLLEFIVTVEEMEANRVYPDCLCASLDIGTEAESNEEIFGIPHLDRDALKSFLVTFRRFTLQGDACFLDRVYEDALDHFRSSRIERWIKLSRARVTSANT